MPRKVRVIEVLVVVALIVGGLAFVVPRMQALRTIGSRMWALGELNQIAFSRDDKLLASGSTDKTVKLWDAETGKELRSLAGHSARVMSVAFSPDGKRLASAGHDGTVRIWDAASGEETLALTSSARMLNCV